MAKAKSAALTKDDLRRQIISKAIVDPAFRKELFQDPHRIFGSKLKKADLEAIERLKKFLPALDDIVTNLAGEVLCGGGGGCGGLA